MSDVMATQERAIADASAPGVAPVAGAHSAVNSAFASTPALTASERLAASRSALRGAMLDIVHPPKRAPLLGGRGGDLLQEILAKARTLPGAAIVFESVEGWWKQHPLRTAGVLAGSATRAFITPMAQRNLRTLIFGAAAAGALFALSRPWRWLLRPALFVGLLPQLVSQVMKHMPVESWIRMATSMSQPRRTPPTPKAADSSRSSPLPESGV
jgi:hypothetical protein